LGRWRVWLIAALWVVLIAQFAIAGRAAYPAVTMPDFSAENVGAHGLAHVVQRRVDIVDGDGSLRPVGVAALFAPLHAGPASLTLDRLLEPSRVPQPEPETVEWLKAQTIRLGLTPNPVGLRVVWQPMVFDSRTRRSTPAGEATVREVRW
jgi:hypothetical protein